MTILAATTNAHKLRELRMLLIPYSIRLLSPHSLGELPECEETGETFRDNAIAKADCFAKWSSQLVLADDSGLEIKALDGAPGIRSARYLGPEATDANRMEALLRRMDGVRERSARFVCVIAVARPDGIIGSVEGELKGEFAEEARGNNGFGYDPVFIPKGYTKTLGELGASEKNRISHRSNAIRNAIATELIVSRAGR